MNAHANAAGTAPQRLNSRMAKVPRRRNMQVVYRQSLLANKAIEKYAPVRAVPRYRRLSTKATHINLLSIAIQAHALDLGLPGRQAQMTALMGLIAVQKAPGYPGSTRIE